MSETIDYDEAVASAYQAVTVVDAAYAIVLLESGIPEDEVIAIQKAVRGVIAVVLGDAELPTEAEG